MKRVILGILILVLIGCEPVVTERMEERPEPVGVEEAKGEISLVIDDGENQKVYEMESREGLTVLGGLEAIAEREGLELEVEEYDFGRLVVGIEGKNNSEKKAWIYLVNGASGEVGAGEKSVKAGDEIRWEYKEPIF